MAITIQARLSPDLALPTVLTQAPAPDGARGRGGAEGAVISKRLPDGGERPGAHMSRRLTASEMMQMEQEPFSHSGWHLCNSLNA